MGSIYGKGPRGKATRLHAQIVRARGRCEACGSQRNLQCAHIVSRRYAHTRTDLANAFCLCAGCHLHYTHWPLEFARFTADRIGLDAYDDLKQRAQQTGKVDWEAEADRLAAIWRDIETNQRGPA